MALVSDKFVFLHIPKAGGMWVRSAIRRCGIKTEEFGHHHTYLGELFEYADEDFYKDKLVFTFVRHPISWYRSRWAFRMKNGWVMQHPLDFACASNNFPNFIDNCLTVFPNGWMTHLYHHFIDTVPGMVGFVGRQENLVNDFLVAMKLAGQSVDEQLVRETPIINDSVIDGYTPKQLAVYPPGLTEQVLKVEHAVIEKYYQSQ